MSSAVVGLTMRSREEDWSRYLLSHSRVMRDFLVAMDIIAPGVNIQIHSWESYPYLRANCRHGELICNQLPLPLRARTWVLASPSGKPLKVILVEIHEVADVSMETRTFQKVCLLRQKMEEVDLVRRDGKPLAIYPLLVFVGRETSTGDIRLPQFEPEGEISTWHSIKMLQVSHYRQGDIPDENLMSSLVSLEQCRNLLLAGTENPVLAQVHRHIRNLDGQVGNDSELTSRLKAWMMAGFGDMAIGLGMDLQEFERVDGLGGILSLIKVLHSCREDFKLGHRSGNDRIQKKPVTSQE